MANLFFIEFDLGKEQGGRERYFYSDMGVTWGE